MRLMAGLLALLIVAAACGSGDEASSEPDVGLSGDRSTSATFAASATTMAAGSDGAALAPSQPATTAATAENPASTADRTEAAGSVTDAQLYEPPRENPPEGVITQDYGTNPFVATTQDSLSTFALDVDTASYTLARNWVQAGEVPLPELIRVEEFVNFFDQDYPSPGDGTFAVFADGAPTPFTQSSRNHMVRVGIKAREVAETVRPDAVLTFVVDASGSMREGNRMEMVKGALATLVDQLRPTDTVAIVAYDTNAWVVLDPTAAENRGLILDRIASLRPGGSTNAEAGLTMGYDIAASTFESGLINRVILASDGVANVGDTSPEGILYRIQEQASNGINLVTVGVGLGNYNDVLLEQLANDGDGFYAYVDTLAEAERLFVEGLTGTLLTVAEEAKVQVEFNPQTVSSYRLLGFENRAIADQDFRNDTVDAGEIGAGHEVTALYEVTLARPLSELGSAQLATVNLRWREPGTAVFSEFNGLLPATVLDTSFTVAEPRFQLDVLAAAYAEVLRQSPWANEVTYSWVAEEAGRLASQLNDPDVWEFAELTGLAAALAGEPVAVLGQP
ncbi:MAG: von Willebrand factor type A domain-containing protein [Acidimicrobiia bacterium]|nr:von Willebrand factor type A domain-containing protein [Acidimicrobiia bacterium]